MAVFWVVAPCSLVEFYQRFRGPCCLHHQGDEYSHLRNFNFVEPGQLSQHRDCLRGGRSGFVSRPTLGLTQPPIQWVPGVLFPGVKRTGREADHSPPSNAEMKKGWSYTSTTPYVFMAWCFINTRGNFAFLAFHKRLGLPNGLFRIKL
jgi:hypothetical protein